MKNNNQKNYIAHQAVDNFLSNVNKLGGNSKQTSHSMIGIVKYCGHYTACGARKFSLSKSKLVRNGSWSLHGLREALHDAVA